MDRGEFQPEKNGHQFDIAPGKFFRDMPKAKRFEIHQDGMTIEGDNLPPILGNRKWTLPPVIEKDRKGKLFKWQVDSWSGEVKARDLRAAAHAVVDQMWKVPYPPTCSTRMDILIKESE